MILQIITVGTLKEGYLKDALAEYKKRLSQYARVEETSIAEVRIANEDDRSEIARALSAEGDKIIAAMPKDAYKIALCVEGREYDSPALAELISRGGDKSGKISLVIGSSYGLAPEVKSAARLRLSVSDLTFPHQLMRVILYEAIYRCYQIAKGSKYHK